MEFPNVDPGLPEVLEHSSLGEIFKPREQRVLRAFDKFTDGRASVFELIKETGLPRSTVYRALDNLRNLGAVRKTADTKMVLSPNGRYTSVAVYKKINLATDSIPVCFNAVSNRLMPITDIVDGYNPAAPYVNATSAAMVQFFNNLVKLFYFSSIEPEKLTETELIKIRQQFLDTIDFLQSSSSIIAQLLSNPNIWNVETMLEIGENAVVQGMADRLIVKYNIITGDNDG